MKICAVEICDGEADASRNMCGAHYRRWRLGMPLDVQVTRKVQGGAPCTIPNCKNKVAGRGLCHTHLNRAERGADLYAPVHSYIKTDNLEERLRHYAPEGDPDECWEWTGAINKNQGMISVANSKLRGAHIVAWEIANGADVPAGLVVRHRCDNGICTNPGHLEIGTHADNVQDMFDRGRRDGVSNAGSRHRTPEEVEEVKRLHAEGRSFSDIARRLGGTRQSAAKIVRGESYQNAGRRKSSLTKLSDNQVRELRSLYASGDYSQQDLANKFGIHQTAASLIIRGKTYPHVQ